MKTKTFKELSKVILIAALVVSSMPSYGLPKTVEASSLNDLTKDVTNSGGSIYFKKSVTRPDKDEANNTMSVSFNTSVSYDADKEICLLVGFPESVKYTDVYNNVNCSVAFNTVGTGESVAYRSTGLTTTAWKENKADRSALLYIQEDISENDNNCNVSVLWQNLDITQCYIVVATFPKGSYPKTTIDGAATTTTSNNNDTSNSNNNNNNNSTTTTNNNNNTTTNNNSNTSTTTQSSAVDMVLSTPTDITLTKLRSGSSAQFTVEGFDQGYRVEILKDGDVVDTKTGSSSRGTVSTSKIKERGVYSYRAQSYKKKGGEEYESDWTEEKYFICSPKSTTSFRDHKWNKAVLKWEKVEGAKKYIITGCDSKDGKFKKIKTVKGSKTSAKITKIGKKKKLNLDKGPYYFRIYAVNDEGVKSFDYAEIRVNRVRKR